MTEWEAITKRISCRAFEDRMIDDKTADRIREYVDELNQESGLHFQLFVSGQKDTPAIRMSAAMFSGNVYMFAALVGGDDLASSEKIGYYGQKLVLYATQLGLGTCWVASTYDASSIHVDISEGEKLWDVIPMGYARSKVPMKQKMIRAAIRKRDRKQDQFLESDMSYADAPAWIRKGIEAIFLGPSAVNQQPVNIVYRNGKVSARIWKKGNGLEYNDLGIAKRQFEVGAESAGVRGHFQMGNEAEFVIEKGADS